MLVDSLGRRWEPTGWRSHQFFYDPLTDLFRCGCCGAYASVAMRDEDIDREIPPCPANPHHSPGPPTPPEGGTG